MFIICLFIHFACELVWNVLVNWKGFLYITCRNSVSKKEFLYSFAKHHFRVFTLHSPDTYLFRCSNAGSHVFLLQCCNLVMRMLTTNFFPLVFRCACLLFYYNLLQLVRHQWNHWVACLCSHDGSVEIYTWMNRKVWEKLFVPTEDVA